jgi:ATP-dependent Clp protease ATP-binding subunit ClpX
LNIGEVVEQLVQSSVARGNASEDWSFGESSESAKADEPSSQEERSSKRADATRGVLVIDEFDKIAYSPGMLSTSNQERHFEAVQSCLLPLFEGKKIMLGRTGGTNTFDTSRLLLLAAGAFVHAEIAKSVSQRGAITKGHWSGIRHEDLIKFGFIPELVGRIRAIVPVETLDSKQLAQIFANALRKKEFEILGCRVRFEEGVIEHLARRANDLNLGARAVGIVYERIKLHVYQKAPGVEVNANNIVLTREYAESQWPEDI